MGILYNVIEDYKNNITDTDLKKIINKKLLNIIVFMETYVNEVK